MRTRLWEVLLNLQDGRINSREKAAKMLRIVMFYNMHSNRAGRKILDKTASQRQRAPEHKRDYRFGIQLLASLLPFGSSEFLHDSITFLLRHVAMHGRNSEVTFSHFVSQPVNLSHDFSIVVKNKSTIHDMSIMMRCVSLLIRIFI